MSNNPVDGQDGDVPVSRQTVALLVQEVRNGFKRVTERQDAANGTLAELAKWRIEIDQGIAVKKAVEAALGGQVNKTDVEAGKLEALKETLKVWGPVINTLALIGAAAAVAIPQLVK